MVAEPSALPLSTGSPLAPLNNLQEERTAPNSLSLQPEAWKNVTKIKKKLKACDVPPPKKKFLQFASENFPTAFLGLWDH